MHLGLEILYCVFVNVRAKSNSMWTDLIVTGSCPFCLRPWDNAIDLFLAVLDREAKATCMLQVDE